MKRVLSFVLAITLLIPNFLTLRSSATEADISDYEQHIALAKETFPEHTSKLSGCSTSRNIDARVTSSEMIISIRETRFVDSNTVMTYTEYANGLVTLGTARFSKTAEIDIVDSETYSGYELYTATIVATVVEGPTFTASNVQYRIYPVNYDRITRTGTPSIPGYTSADFDISSRSYETADLPAFVSYSFDCPVGSYHYSGAVVFEIKNNRTSVEFDIW